MAGTTRLFKRKAILAKIEATGGADPNPTAAINAIEARNVQLTPLDGTYQVNDPETPYFGASPEVAAARSARISYDVTLQGSGAAGTAAAYGPLLRGCGMAETILAAAVTGTAQAGGAGTMTLAASASAVDNAYRGLRITTTAGTGSGQENYILAYNGTTKIATMVFPWATAPDATTQYQLPPQVSYRPITAGTETLTHYIYIDGNLHKLPWSRGNAKIALPPKNFAKMSLDFAALYTDPTDTPLPTSVVLSGFKAPVPVNNQWTSGFLLHGFAANLYDLSIDLGQKVQRRDDVIGADDTVLTDRESTGSITIGAPLLAEKDYYAICRDATLGPLKITHGTTAGSRIRMVAPSVQLKAPKLQDKDGVTSMAMDMRLVMTNGDDELFVVLD